ncbi:hypothetical protein BGZ73_000117 [Actinomortierella ambigua]|nr:hypothetical protein BGZ73_000117 [Actinomortierella ambigua]
MNNHLAPSTPRHHRALDVPEILLEIFKHLLLPDATLLMAEDIDHGLAPSFWYPLLTCRYWYTVGSQAGFRSVTLDQGEEFSGHPTNTLDLLANCQQLCLKFEPKHGGLVEESEMLDVLAKGLRPGAAAPLLLPPAPSSAPPSPAPPPAPPPAQQQHQQLLGIQQESSSSSSAATAAVAEATTPSSMMRPLRRFHLPYLRHLLLSNAWLPLFPSSWTPSRTFRLTTLRLHNVYIHLADLHRLLLAIASTWLEQVSLRQIVLPDLSGPFSPRQVCQGRDFLSASFLKAWTAQCPHLRWLQMGDWGENDSFNLLLWLRGYLPRLEKLECLQNNSPPAPVRPWMAFTKCLTRLEVVGVHGWTMLIPMELHRFLCSDLATHLEELCLPGIEYHSSFFDPATSTSPPPPSGGRPERHEQRTGSWVCRKLKRLVLSVNPDDHFVPPQFNDGPMAGYARASRGVCGFVVVSCPELRSFELRFPEHPLTLDPDSGLCFLGRLRFLEHFVLRGTHALKERGYWHKFIQQYGYGNRSDYSSTGSGGGAGGTIASDGSIQDPSVKMPTSRPLSLSSLVSFRSLPILKHGNKASSTMGTDYGLSTLRWMAVNPTDDDYARQWTNLAHCRYLAKLDWPKYQEAPKTASEAAAKIKSALSSTIWNSHYKPLQPAWTKDLARLLGLGEIEGRMSSESRETETATRKVNEGSCWRRLQTFTCLIDYPYPRRTDKSQTFVEYYMRALKQVLLPQVQVSIQWVDTLGAPSSNGYRPMRHGISHLE